MHAGRGGEVWEQSNGRWEDRKEEQNLAGKSRCTSQTEEEGIKGQRETKVKRHVWFYVSQTYKKSEFFILLNISLALSGMFINKRLIDWLMENVSECDGAPCHSLCVFLSLCCTVTHNIWSALEGDFLSIRLIVPHQYGEKERPADSQTMLLCITM